MDWILGGRAVSRVDAVTGRLSLRERPLRSSLPRAIPFAVLNFPAKMSGKSKPWKTILWLAGIAFALLPIAFNYANARLDGKTPEWPELLAGGELLLISAVAADAVSNALVGGQKYRLPRYLCGFCCFLVVAFTSMYFARIAYSLQEHRDLLETAVRSRNWQQALGNLNSGMSHAVIARDSMGFFAVTIIAAWGVILTAEE
jgi:hypothetical protein